MVVFYTEMEYTGIKIRTILAEDNPLFCEGIYSLLNQEDDIECVAWTCNGDELIHLTSHLRPDIVLLDIFISHTNGMEATKLIKSQFPEIHIIMITKASAGCLFEAIKSGADAFIPKSANFKALTQAIRSVYLNEAVFDYKSLESIRARLEGNNNSLPNDELSEREREIVRHIGYGIPTKHIAAHLSLAERTVNMHLDRIYQKLGVNTRVQAVLKGLRYGWFTLEDLGV